MKTNAKALSPTLESYLETIQDLQAQYGAVRVTDLAEKMGCRLPTVTSALRRLSGLELIKYETYRPVVLTNRGETTVRKMSGRHRILADFFKSILCLSGEVAEEEACRLEHKISEEILHRLGLFMEFTHGRNNAGAALKKLQTSFREYIEEQKQAKPILRKK